MKELKQQEELAEINRRRLIYAGVWVCGVILIGIVVGFRSVHHWGSWDIGAMVFGVIVGVAGLVGALRLGAKRQEYLRHMEEDTEGDK